MAFKLTTNHLYSLNLNRFGPPNQRFKPLGALLPVHRPPSTTHRADGRADGGGHPTGARPTAGRAGRGRSLARTLPRDTKLDGTRDHADRGASAGTGPSARRRRPPQSPPQDGPVPPAHYRRLCNRGHGRNAQPVSSS